MRLLTLGKPWLEPNDAPAADVLAVVRRMAQEFVYNCPGATKEMYAEVTTIWHTPRVRSSRAE